MCEDAMRSQLLFEFYKPLIMKFDHKINAMNSFKNGNNKYNFV